MKLPTSDVSLEGQLAEFDLWITPSLQEIQDTEKYSQELQKVDGLINRLGKATRNFETADCCTPEAIALTCIDLIEKVVLDKTRESEKSCAAEDILDSLFSLLFMVTGKTDNNLKCQFPVYLEQTEARTHFPQRSRKSGLFRSATLGRTIKSDKLAKVIADALVGYSSNKNRKYLETEAQWLLAKYINAIIKDDASVKQLWALGRSYYSLRDIDPGSEKALLAPIVIFKVRGSVSASGGHIPENILRDIMIAWGMERGVDFNTDDVILAASDDMKKPSSKTRAYDFLLPYKTEGWSPHIFIQCQFYAGDSGSVSHKVVDQTQASRTLTLQNFPDARFIEYLDGAGYYSSLNTDLRHMLGMESTKDFIQVRSAHIKLRRELQAIGFLTPLDIEHAIFRSQSGSKTEIIELLRKDGYSAQEIDRALRRSIERKLIHCVNSEFKVNEERAGFAKKMFIIDLIAITGGPVNAKDAHSGNALIPGYGKLYGSQLSSLSQSLDVYAPNSFYSRNEFAECVTWLISKKLIVLR